MINIGQRKKGKRRVINMEKGFDNTKYVKIQSQKIRERFKLFDRLYL